VSYNANVVKIYNTTLILLRFEENNILHWKNAMAYYKAGVVVVHSKIPI
jgi:hypothetical protein